MHIPLLCCMMLMYFHDDLFTFDNSFLKLGIAGKGLLRATSGVKLNGISALTALSPGRPWEVELSLLGIVWWERVSVCVLAECCRGAWSWPELYGRTTHSFM